MPTYDYKCEKCGHSLEAYQPITDNPLKKCPKCGKNGLKRQIGAGAALIFKGSGFYCTDYRKSGGSTPSSSSKSGGNGNGSSCPASGDTKSAACANCPSGGAKDTGSSKDSKASKE